MKKILLGLTLVVVVGVLILAVAGYAQADPQEVTVSARLKQPPEAVFATLVGSKATLEPTVKALGKKFGEDVQVSEQKGR